jgi:ornithine carbamoyltransferase
MGPTLRHHDQPACEHLSPAETSALLASAGVLQRAAAAGKPQPLLRGKHVGLLCDDDAQRDALLFRQAAAELGAQVAHIRNSLSAGSSSDEIQHTARMLGRLYDAVECQGMDPHLVELVAADAGVPVYAGIATTRHPTAALAEQIEGNAGSADKRRYLLQALLLSTIV